MNLWTYRASIARAVDGDTVQGVFIDCGFCAQYRPPTGLRLLGINTPELHATDPDERARAVQARSYTAYWLVEHATHLDAALSVDFPFYVVTQKTDHFARWLATVTCGQGHSLIDDLLASGLAVPYMTAGAAAPLSTVGGATS
jgi:endonuclease YncB( thermonuclease family)